MELKILLVVAVVICVFALLFVALSIRKLNGIQIAADRLFDFRNQVNGTRRRVTSIQRVATAQGGSTDTGGVFALYDLHQAIQFADQVISTAENLIEARTPAALQACCELFDDAELVEEEPLSPKAKYCWSKGFSSSSWKRQVDHLVEKAESSILGTVEETEEPKLAA